jgi:hypothetical protein
MSKHIFMAVVCTLCISISSAQSWKFRSDDYLGLSSGQWGNYGLLQTVDGVAKGPWFLGLGAGLDNYRFQSAPLFVSVTRDLPVFWKGSGQKSGFFLHLDGGLNLPLYKRTITPYDDYTTSKFHAGSWWSAGLGYKWKLGARTDKALLLSVDYSEKRLKEVQGSSESCQTLTCYIYMSNPTYVYEYLNRVFLFKIGFMF